MPFASDTTLTGLSFANNNAADEGYYYFEVVDSKGCASAAPMKYSFVPVQNELMASTSISGSVLTLDALTGGTAPYTLLIDDVAMGEVMAGDTYDGLMVGDTVTATIMDAHGCSISMDVTGTDIEAPVPVAYSPVPGTTLADNYPAFVVTFDEDIQFNQAGNLYVYKVGSTIPRLTIPITAEMVNGDSIMVPNTYYDPENGGLNKDTEYSVTFDAGVVADMAGNASEGLTDKTVWTFTTGGFLTGVEDPISGSLEFKVYPNPFSEQIFVDNADKLSRIIITNVAGQRVRVITSPTKEVQTNDLHSGVYFMTLITKDDVVAKTERIVKR
jgi:hypothetical protein